MDVFCADMMSNIIINEHISIKSSDIMFKP